MKKISILALGLAVCATAGAQTSVLKEAEQAMKGGQEAAKVVNIITPAFSNAETQGLAQTYYIPGKASYNEYDKLLGLKQFGKTKEEDNAKMGKLLIQGYDMFMKALPLDSVPNEKGKIKPKYSKEMISTIAGHFTDYTNAGADLYNSKDYDGAYRAWAIFNEIPQNPTLREKLTNVPADTILGEIAFNQALAAWQGNHFEDALNAFLFAKSKGYSKKQLYDYAIAVADGAKNREAVLALSEEALGLYGDQDPMYLGQVVNYYLQSKDFDKAFEIINQAIAKNPDNSQYYNIQGVLYENVEKRPEAIAAYKKATELDPKNAQALYNYGRQLCESAYALNDAAPTSQKEYEDYKEAKIMPLFKEAVDVLENAYAIDPDNLDVLKYLENVYYNLGDEAKLNDVRKRMTY